MIVVWGNGYGIKRAPTTEVARRFPSPEICDGCLVKGDRVAKRVACMDTSRGEYSPVYLCHECLVDLANELVE